MQELELTLLEKLGEGTFGCVWQARDPANKQTYAVKITNLDDDGIPTTSLREISIGQSLSHPNVVQLLREPRLLGMTHLCLVFEECEMNLKEYASLMGCPDVCKLRTVTQHLLSGLAHMHSRGFVHRDLKPQNLLVNRTPTLTLRIGDLGSARALFDPKRAVTLLVGTRWYRPIELLLGAEHYGFEVDMWAVGCVIAEMATGTPLFRGASQIETIFHILRRRGRICPHAHPVLAGLPHYNADMPQFRGRPELFDAPDVLRPVESLVDALLDYTPANRPSPSDCLMHEFCAPAPSSRLRKRKEVPVE